MACGLVAGLEFALRQLGFDRQNATFTFASAFPRKAESRFLQPDDERFFTLAPNYRHNESHVGRYANGPWPFRGRPPEPAPPGTLRVAFLGNSCVYGTGVSGSETLPFALQQALIEEGYGPEAVQILNYGVPGYSSVQVGELLRQVLSEVEPDAVVLYPAAWNDQAPALGKNDVQLREQRPKSALVRTFRSSAVHAALSDVFQPRTVEAADNDLVQRVMDRWQDDETLLGPRVPEDHVADELRTMLASCEAAGVPTVVIVPTHPDETAERHTRTRRDAASVRDVLRTEERWLDAEELRIASGLSEEEFFIDFVHLGPAGAAVLAEEVAPLLAPLLPPRSQASAVAEAPEVVSITPDSLSHLGDARVRIELDRPLPGTGTPVVLVGGTPLFDVQQPAPHVLEGMAPENAPGSQPVWVQTDAVCFVAGELRYEPARIEPVWIDGEIRQIRIQARPGDRVLVFAAEERRAKPRWSPRGAGWLAAKTRYPDTRQGTCDASGSVRFDLPPRLKKRGLVVTVQALVQPGNAAEGPTTARWSEPLTLDMRGD